MSQSLFPCKIWKFRSIKWGAIVWLNLFGNYMCVEHTRQKRNDTVRWGSCDKFYNRIPCILVPKHQSHLFNREWSSKIYAAFLQGSTFISIIRRGSLALHATVAWQLKHFPTRLFTIASIPENHTWARSNCFVRNTSWWPSWAIFTIFPRSSCVTTIRSPRTTSPSTTASSLKPFENFLMSPYLTSVYNWLVFATLGQFPLR